MQFNEIYWYILLLFLNAHPHQEALRVTSFEPYIIFISEIQLSFILLDPWIEHSQKDQNSLT